MWCNIVDYFRNKNIIFTNRHDDVQDAGVPLPGHVQIQHHRPVSELSDSELRLNMRTQNRLLLSGIPERKQEIDE